MVQLEKGKVIGASEIKPENMVVKKEIENLEANVNWSLKDTLFDEIEVYKITNPKSNEEYYYEKDTFLLLAYVSQSYYGESTTRYSDYRNVGDYIFPFNESVTFQNLPTNKK